MGVTVAKDQRAPFERVADELRARIRSGDLKPGQRLPSGRELAETYGIALATAQNALKRLKGEGLASSSPRGYVVASELPARPEDLRRELEETRADLLALKARVERLERAAGT